MAAADSAAAVGCVFDLIFVPAQRALVGRGRFDHVKFGA